MSKRQKTRVINVGGVKIGGENPIVIQSMTTTCTADTAATLKQIQKLAQAGCEVVRLAVPDSQSAKAIKTLASKSPIPLVADIHFDYRLALQAIASGASKIRFNPGNIGEKANIHKLVANCQQQKIPIRIGVNAGSLEKRLDNSPLSLAEKLATSALDQVRILENLGFDAICLSVKAADASVTIQANQLLAQKTNYPLHLGITESGYGLSGEVRSICGLAPLLTSGIGDTIRISLTTDPVREVTIAKEILQALNLRRFQAELISCPTCGRNQVAIDKICQQLSQELANLPKNLRLAVMGCAVNGPGEAKMADYALIARSKDFAIFKHGKMIKTTTLKSAKTDFLQLIQQHELSN
jgi:(E)-4-hydroxy-3-methylbut-2-enyl-diphosphate synthase